MDDLISVLKPIEHANGLPNACYIDENMHAKEANDIQTRMGGDWIWMRCPRNPDVFISRITWHSFVNGADKKQ